MATNHLRSSTFVFSNIVPTRHEKFLPHCLQRYLLSFLSRQWCPPQYGHTMSPFAHLLSMMACLHFSSELKYIVRETRLSNLLKSIINLHFLKIICKITTKSNQTRFCYTYNIYRLIYRKNLSAPYLVVLIMRFVPKSISLPCFFLRKTIQMLKKAKNP